MPSTKVLEKPMKMTEIKAKAKALGIDSKKMKKVELIHAIQAAEGYNTCFGRSNGQCQYTSCCFIWDCLKNRL